MSKPVCFRIGPWLLLGCALLVLLPLTQRPAFVARAEPATVSLANAYAEKVRPLMKAYCTRCHSAKNAEAEVDLDRFGTLAEVRKDYRTWQKVLEMLDSGQMPPREDKQPTESERSALLHWVRAYLKHEAKALAGDPGPVVLRRLTNAEYTYTIQDLTGLPLEPARQFPADGAAGEGFTNAGQALVMSPALLQKYLDAGKEIASHAVLLPDGIRFASGTTRQDWSNELVAEIKRLYGQHADPEGKVPLTSYLAATLQDREALLSGAKTPAEAAAERGLNPKYLETLWQVLTQKDASPVLAAIRERWIACKPNDAANLAAEVGRWQQMLTRFQNVGHLKPWVVPLNPLVARQEIRLKLQPLAEGGEVVIHLGAANAGDGAAGDLVVWDRPRLVTPGRPDLLLRDVRAYVREMTDLRQRAFAATSRCLAAAAEASGKDRPKVNELATKHQVDAEVLLGWLEFLGLGLEAQPALNHFTGRIESAGNYGFVKGWGSHETPLIVANSSGQHVRIPGNMKAHGVAVHPSPTRYAAVGWRSPVNGAMKLSGSVTHAHPECGNGVTWSVEHRRGSLRQKLASGVAHGAREMPIGPIDLPGTQVGDLVSLLVGPRDGNHACDLTDIELVIKEAGDGGKEWRLTRDVADDILAGNPHADRLGNQQVWHFYTEPVMGGQGPNIPAGSLLARWLAAEAGEQKAKFADDLERLLVGGPPAAKDHPDALLYRQLAALSGPLLAGMRRDKGTSSPETVEKGEAGWGLASDLFGRLPSGEAIDAASLCVQAPNVFKLRLPADLIVESELVASVRLHESARESGSVQIIASQAPPQRLDVLLADPAAPVLTAEGSPARQRFEAGYEEFRQVFPSALCYSQVVPVDEVVTLALYHREDEPLQRLMLDAKQKARLDRLWTELYFVSQHAFAQVDAFKQLMEYATQDSDPRLFEPFRKPIQERAEQFRRQLQDAEPAQLAAVLELASLAYRRPLSAAETGQLRDLYAELRRQEAPHDEAIRLTLARVFVSPAFLYRMEKPPAGAEPGPLSDWELANRLSYFLWASLPDAELRRLSAEGRLRDPEVLTQQARRMLKDSRVRRMATEFACQWLHIYGFDKLDEKSERHFPSFKDLRDDMYEESIRFFTDLFQRDGSVLSILDADHMFVNDALAGHYGIPGVSGAEWRRMDGARKHGRGGILAFSTTLAQQSGASRTSPILRGNWVSEVLLGEKLPRPPKDVPQLPDDESASAGLTVRQLVEKHSSDQRCAVCHARIDPLGFALEGYDAIGRRRTQDAAGRPVEVRSRLKDGTEIDGLDGLREHLLTVRRDAFIRQFNRKLLGYALGRGLQLSDEPLLDAMKEHLEQQEYRSTAAVETIVRSKQFREIRGKDFGGEQ